MPAISPKDLSWDRSIALKSSTAGRNGHIVGTFESDLDPSLLPLPAGETVVPETRAGFDFSNAFMTAIATSDVEVPELASLALLGAGLLGFGFFRHRRKSG